MRSSSLFLAIVGTQDISRPLHVRKKKMRDLAVVLMIAMLIAGAEAKTNSLDVPTFNVLYSSMNSPSQLTGWQSSGGDLCGNNWYGFECLGSSKIVGFQTHRNDGLPAIEFDFGHLFVRKPHYSFCAVSYALADLQSATGNFATGRLIGEGTIGRVYRAKYADGKVLVKKKIESSLFQGRKPEEFSEIVTRISALHHLNITELFGYCMEQGHDMLVYECFRNGSLHEFLHLSDDFSKPLTWNTRVRIALGTARAVEYLHEVCLPSTTHKNIKSSSILLDMELNPRLSDCGLGTFHQRTSQNLGAGYNAPECTKPAGYTLKSDVYGFSVVVMELLTGRMPLDRPEQCLVRRAMPQLHDIDALERIMLSRFVDIIALCVQVNDLNSVPEPETILISGLIPSPD